MPFVDLIERILWIAPTILLGVMSLVMFRRGLHRRLPIFFGYITFHVFRSCILLWAHAASYQVYFYSYWISELLDCIFVFAVIYAIFEEILRPYPGLRHIGILLYRWASVVLILIASVSAAAAPGNDAARLMAGMFALERSVLVVQCGLFFFVFLFASSLGISWRHNAFGIALGLGIWASIELAVVTIRAHFGGLVDPAYTILKQAAYNCAVLVWMGYLLTSEKQVVLPKAIPHSELNLWNRALMEMLYR